MREWLAGLEFRERLLVIVATIVLALFLLFVLVLKPLHASYNNLRTNVAEQRVSAVWMEQSASQVKQLQGSRGARVQGLGGRSLLSVTDSTARAGGLETALERVEPEGSNGVRVWLKNAAFDDLVKWLAQLDAVHGVFVDSLTLERNESAGRVDTRLTLQAAQP